jgi:hypothetical protein
LFDKVAGTLTLPPTMHLDQLIEIDSPESVLPRLSEKADLMVLGHDHPALSGHTPFGHTTSTIGSMSRHPVVAVPRGWTQRADDRRPIAVAIDGRHPSTGTLGYAFSEASLRQVPLVHAAPLAELVSGETTPGSTSRKSLPAGRPTTQTSPSRPFCWPDLRAPSPRSRQMCSCWSSTVPTAAGNGHAGSVQSRAPHSIWPPVRSPSFRSNTLSPRQRIRAWRASGGEHTSSQLVRAPARSPRISQCVPGGRELTRLPFTKRSQDGDR